MTRGPLIFVVLVLASGTASADSPKPAAPPEHKVVAQPALTTPAPSNDKQPNDSKPATHFAVLRSEKVNLRTGPSTDYPIDWVFTRKGLPVEVVATFDIWRKIRDSEGTVGWVNQQMLADRRNVLVTGAVRVLRKEASPDSPMVAQLEPGVIARLSRCDPGWCEVKIQGYSGWLQRSEIWGLAPGEVVQ